MPDETTAALDTDNLPPTQYLILEVLAARYRTGEQVWTFPSRVRHHLDALARLGLIGCRSGIVPRTALAWFTEAGRRAALLEGYEPQAVKDAYAAGREAAVQAILDHADKYAPQRASALRRRLLIAARVAAGPMTDAQVVEAIRRGDFAVCRLDEAGRPIGGESDG